jgi:hypothetical protein
MNHSPAPWTLSESGNSIRDANGRIIAIVDCERKENGPLFAAAAELLSELKLAAVANRNLAEMVLGRNHTFRDEVIRIAERQEAVIDKAQRAHDPNSSPSTAPEKSANTKESS